MSSQITLMSIVSVTHSSYKNHGKSAINMNDALVKFNPQAPTRFTFVSIFHFRLKKNKLCQHYFSPLRLNNVQKINTFSHYKRQQFSKNSTYVQLRNATSRKQQYREYYFALSACICSFRSH